MPLFKRKQEKQKPAPKAAGSKGAGTVKRTPSTRSNPQSPDSLNGDMGVPTTLLSPGMHGSPPQLVLSEEVLEDVQETAETGSTPQSPLKTSSRLSKTLLEILHDKDALRCFIEFMESKQADRFIRFWVDANSFRAATLTRMHSHSLQSVGSSAILKRRSEERGEVGESCHISRSRQPTGASHEPQSQPKESEGHSQPADSSQSGSQRIDVPDGSKLNCDNPPPAPTERGNVGCEIDNSAERVQLNWADHPVAGADSSGSAYSSGSAADSEYLLPSSLSSAEASSRHETSSSNQKVSQPSLQSASNPVYSSQHRHSDTHQQSEDGELTSEKMGTRGSDVYEPPAGAHTDQSLSQIEENLSFKEKACDTESVDTLTEDISSDDTCLDEQRNEKGIIHSRETESVAVRTVEGGSDVQQYSHEGTTTNQSVPVIVSSDNAGESSVSGEENIRPPPEGSEGDEVVARPRTATAEEIREKLKKSIERDAVSIFAKYIAKDAPQPIGVDDDLRGETIRKICREDGQVDPDCFVACQEFVVDYMDKHYHQPFADSEFHCKHQVQVLTGGKVYLADILYNEHALCYFMEFMEQEGASHLMQFWMAADNFQQQLIQQQGHYDGMQAQSDAMILYDRFFSLQATTPLGFDDKIRFEVESNICREEGPLPDCFAKPRDIVLHTMDKIYFTRYLVSDIYYRYLSDLISTVQMSQDLPVKKHRRQASDASSEHSAGSQSLGAESISFRNTLLASGSRTARRSTSSGSLSASAGRVEERLGNMDTDFLNPEKLWTQPKKGSLSLGKVNALGQFVSEFESPDPDGEKKKGGGFFKKRKDKEKEQEQMAMQVAQMILSDVAAMTQMGDACSRRDDENPNALDISATPKSLSAPASAASFFEPPPS